MIDYYEILEVSPKASLEVVRAAYQALLHQYNLEHSSEDQTEVQKLDSLNLAYEVLSDPDRRESYDHELAKVRKTNNKSAQINNPYELAAGNVAKLSQDNPIQPIDKVNEKGKVSSKTSILSWLNWNRWGWIVSILAVVIILISMVRPDPEKAVRGQLAVKSEAEREKIELEAELKKTDMENQQSDPAENKRKSEDTVN